MKQPIIEAVNLKKYFRVKNGLLHAVDGINLKIMEGETLGVVGESGCGKSTLGLTIVGLLKPTSGDVLYRGKSIVKCSKKEMKAMCKKINIIFQDPYSSLNPRMSVSQIIADPIRVNHLYKNSKETEKRVHQLMETVGLARRIENSYPHELDGGRRQRIGVARALALNPEFIICDEPVSSLDVSIQAQILNLLMDLQDNMGLTYMFITHDLSVVRHISQNIMVTYLGKCVEMAPKQELFDNPMHPYTKALFSALPEPTLESRYNQPELLKGEISNPINPKPGCRFVPRCPNCTEACSGEDIPLYEVSADHLVACILYNKKSSQMVSIGNTPDGA